MDRPLLSDDHARRLNLAVVSITACTLIALETVSFQTLVYVNEYLVATQVISVALMGIALGGLLSYFISKSAERTMPGILLTLYPLALLMTFPVIIRLNPHPVLMMILMTVPYVIASMIISLMFNTMKPGIVYLFDLVGAGLGAFLAVAAIPFLREEGSFFLIAAIGCISIIIFSFMHRRRAFAAAGIALFLVCGGLLTIHIAFDSFNMAKTGTCDKKEFPGKIFHCRALREGGKYPFERLKYSRGSLMERIDIEGVFKKHEKGYRRHYYRTWFNGRANDHVSKNPKKKKGILDRRMPTRLKLGTDPDTLLVGPAAEGLTKTVKSLGNGKIDAVEINSALAGLMLNELYEFSAKAYKGLNLTIGDVRTFLKTTDKKYDFITLLNTHRIRTIGHQGPPEYCHTYEAITGYLNHLTNEGYILLEERNINKRADLGIRRFLRTAMKALRDVGAYQPENHIVVYEFPRVKGKRPPRNRYTMVMIKKTPVRKDEYKHLVEWNNTLKNWGKKSRYGKRKLRGVSLRYIPQKKGKNYWTETITADDVYDTKGVDPAIHNMSLITDDRPFPYDVFLAREKPKEMLRTTALLSLLVVLLPSIVTFVARRKSGSPEKSKGTVTTNLLMIFYFAVLGIGYLLIEIVLMQKLGIFLSSPVYSLIVVLGTMLIASGAGGYLSSRIMKKHAVGALFIVVALTVLYFYSLGFILDSLMFLSLAVRVIAAIVLVGVIAFFMGMPFPFAMSMAKRQLSERHAGLFFGINGALAAVATPLSVILSMMYGFSLTLLLGGSAYLVCLVLLAVMRADNGKSFA